MSTRSLLPDPHSLTLDSLYIRDGVIFFDVRTTRATCACPLCGCLADRVHSYYLRTLLALPWQGNAVRIKMTARKFFCDNRTCSRRIFTEPVPTVVARYARKSERLMAALQELTFLAGGEAAARIARAFGIFVSPDALLKALKKVTLPVFPTPKVLGIDDFAFKKGRRYGTILVDLERHCPVDLLPDREADTLSNWLKEHPGVEVASRDRSSEFARGIHEGAPNAVHVADRFHLLVNLRNMLQRVVDRYRTRLKGIELNKLAEAVSHPRQPERSSAQELAGIAHMKERVERHRQIHILLEAGFHKRAIARELGLSPMTVYKYLRHDESGITRRTSRSFSQLDPFMPYLSQRWQDGCHNATQLWRELKERGYPGTARMVLVWAHQQRLTPAPSTPNRYRTETADTHGTTHPASQNIVPSRSRTSSSRQFAWFLLKECASLSLLEQAVLERINQACPELVSVGKMAQQFQEMIRNRTTSLLDEWLFSAAESKQPALARFADGLAREKPSILAALSSPWSNGQTEGQVNRLKFMKRAMYSDPACRVRGRGSFDLLRARMLHQTAIKTLA